MDQTSEPQTGRRLTSVERAIAALEALAAAPNGLRVNELARAIGVAPSSASRMLSTLERHGFAARDDTRYVLGLRIVGLADRVLTRLDLRDLARPYLRGLVEHTGETATLSLPTAGEAVTVDFVPGSSSVVSMAQVGRPNPLHATAIGKVMLAFSDVPPPTAESLTRYTDRTLHDSGGLAHAIEEARRAGWAAAVGEREPDLAALAVPVFGREGKLTAVVGLQGPLARMTASRRKDMVPLLLDAATGLSGQLGAT